MSENKKKDLNAEELNTFQSEDEPTVPPPEVIAYNELR